jgi:hypothetical protein
MGQFFEIMIASLPAFARYLREIRELTQSPRSKPPATAHAPLPRRSLQ